MINQELLQELVSFHVPQNRVVSLYLNTDSAQQPVETIKLQAKSLLKEANSHNEANVAAIDRYLNHDFDWTRPGLALFAATDEDFFRAYPVAVSFRNRIRIGQKPYIKPLAHFLDYYACYGVILVDRLGARFFTYHLGELQETHGFMGEELQKLKLGKGSSAVGMRGGSGGGRHESEVAVRNLRDAAAAASSFFQNKPIRRLFLGGTPETVALFRDELPKQLQSCVAGAFQMDMNAGEHEVRDVTLGLLHEANAQREKKLVKDLLALHAQGATATLGLDDTLQAISERRVQLLLLSDGYRVPGYLHAESGFVVSNLARSPLSDRELTAVPDVVDAAASLTLAQGGRIEVVADDPDLEQAGHIGAILRY